MEILQKILDAAVSERAIGADQSRGSSASDRGNRSSSIALCLPLLVALSSCGTPPPTPKGKTADEELAGAIAEAVFAPREDDFGTDIVIPPDMKIEVPARRPLPDNERAMDSEGREIAEVGAGKGGNTAAAVSTDLVALNAFSGAGLEILHRHLASSPKWLLGSERGKLYAYRRIVAEGGRWTCSLNGFYTAYDFELKTSAYFQYRIVIGLSGPVFERPWRDRLTAAKVGSGTVQLKVTENRGQGYESYLILQSDGPTVEIFEQTGMTSRPLTELALAQVEAELSKLAKDTRAEGFDSARIPSESAKHGDAELHLEPGSQGGIYTVRAYVNPSEKGYVYLKAFEATRGTPLSAGRLRESSLEYTGWSENADEQFYYNTRITIYEGDWGVYYPARFELWFVPDTGEAERKLIEKIFKIEGWQR
jgi:hypothetical protein